MPICPRVFLLPEGLQSWAETHELNTGGKESLSATQAAEKE